MKETIINTQQQNTLQKTDIAIIGGGMVGICLAIMLAKKNRNWSIVLIESFPLHLEKQSTIDLAQQFQPSFDARSTALSAGSKTILEQCELWESLQHHLAPIKKVHVSDKNHLGGSLIDADDHGMTEVGYVVENAWFGRVLMNALSEFENIQIIAPASVKHITPKKIGYAITVSENEQHQIDKKHSDHQKIISADLTIIADGANSALAKSIGIQFEEKDYQQKAIIANIECDQSHEGIAYERFTDEGPIALLPLGKTTSNTMALVWTLPAIENELMQCDDSIFLQTLQQRFGFRQGNFIRVSQRFQYDLKRQLASEQVRRSLVLMGNAAHFLHPVAGQGFNLALRDSQALSELLFDATCQKKNIGDLSVLNRYLEAQQMDQLATMTLSDNFVEWFSSSSTTKSVLRNLGLFALDLVPGATPLLAKRSMGLL